MVVCLFKRADWPVPMIHSKTYPTLAGDIFPRILPVDPDHPAPGWNAVSVSTWKIFGVPQWANRMSSQERVGRSILLALSMI
jgi:hypothetical protein